MPFVERLLQGGNCDIDASVMMLTADMTCTDTVYALQRQSKCGGIKHTGDMSSDSESEAVEMYLNLVPQKVRVYCSCVGIGLVRV